MKQLNLNPLLAVAILVLATSIGVSIVSPTDLVTLVSLIVLAGILSTCVAVLVILSIYEEQWRRKGTRQ